MKKGEGGREREVGRVKEVRGFPKVISRARGRRAEAISGLARTCFRLLKLPVAL